jgi:acylphosphatase
MKRVHLIVSGDVQGVGFRAWTKAQARQIGVVGWVKNREDKAVEVMAEGSKHDLEELVKRCNKGPEVSWVEHVEVDWKEGTGEFVGFEVVY